MPLTLRQVIESPGLRLVPLHVPSQALSAELIWVHSTEIDEPKPYMNGGELVLTAGLRDVNGRHANDYIAHLSASGVVGLGFGTGRIHESVPPPLVEAAREHSFALMEVPRETPFSAISRLVARAVASDEYATLVRLSEAQSALTKLALVPDGFGRFMKRLSSELGTPALLLDPSGKVLAGSYDRDVRGLVDGIHAVQAQRRQIVLSPVKFDFDGRTVSLLPVLSNGHVLRVIVIVADRPPSAVERQIITVATSLVQLSLEQWKVVDGVERHLRSILLRTLATGDVESVRRRAVSMWGPFPDVPLRVLALAGRGAALDRAIDAVNANATHLRGVFHGYFRDTLVVLLPQTPDVFPFIDNLSASIRELTVGSSETVENWADLSLSIRQAVQSLRTAQRRRVPSLCFADIGALGLARVFSNEEAFAFSTSLLTPVLRHQEAGAASELLSSLRAWLEHNGQWNTAAEELNIHRHTLRNRIDKVAELLGKDLQSGRVRAELLLALEILDR
ncbi:PucR family transcriptional regulator ligand-binding domain-containing protein [Phytohabitans sp. ZYX-F-186]|uniref:PucR family transcriptional regulator ligand-binding domain-containing protein n=1 Tax=Phytohabitans maris TaxID=3071409 RepID=A0ABU0ZSH2_9ACTN|nr:PucR family transcriptional regulator ligand-binding domain-containing protein [Phytohabitans sp. ZYX-F-186]MDQ7909925.1 PucR family transcriptional regulator ligand-binding domain-containing protein [Phytohabitans sp. ZYX-F-186]